MITFKGVHANAYNLGAKITSWSMVPASSDTYVDIPGRHGSYHFPGKRRDLLIGLEFAFMGSSLVDMYSKSLDIKAWLYTEECDSISFDFLPGKYFIGKPEGEIDLEPFFVLGKFEASFRCEPFTYGAEVQASFAADAATVDNQGTYETPPRFTVTLTAVATEWKVMNQDGYYIRIVHDFAIGDTLEVNCKTGAILINAARAMNELDWQNSRFFDLRVGTNVLTVTPAGVSSTRVYWTPQHL